MSAPLPPLGLDDLRVAEPDRDSEARFDPSETWYASCNAIEYGHSPATVAGVLLTLDNSELVNLRDWWADECGGGGERDANCPDLALCNALIAAGWDWFLPSIDAATVLPLLDERDRLRAALEAAATYLGDDSTDDSPEARATREVIREALR